jgi:excisionase family DNA binding protein
MTEMSIQELDETVRATVAEAVDQALAQRAASVETGWLSVERAAEYLDMTAGAVRAAIKRGQLEPYRTPTGRVRFSREMLDLWVWGGDAE